MPTPFTPHEVSANSTPSPYPVPSPAGTSANIAFIWARGSSVPLASARWNRLRSPAVEMTSPAAPSQVMFCSVASNPGPVIRWVNSGSSV
ncbi:hypothetical protein ACPCAB_15665 [Streptomyces koyangensis]|uniref:hypothetical protein n=1 Tax=Streptomyces koyangensis TaxID=188770 RepID=UPI003C2DA8E7